MRAEKPENESARLEALRKYRLLDTDHEKSFDEITTLASYICETPIALMVLLDENRQWFKSRVGLTATETPREYAFCAHAILGNSTLVVEDATKDLRFADNPLVTDEPNIRFYAGTPLINGEGLSMGTLCVIDSKSRGISSVQLSALETLAHQVVAQMELLKVTQDLAKALEGVKLLETLLPICAWCKGVRNDAGFWNRVEDYLTEKTGHAFTHSICPNCLDAQTNLIIDDL